MRSMQDRLLLQAVSAARVALKQVLQCCPATRTGQSAGAQVPSPTAFCWVQSKAIYNDMQLSCMPVAPHSKICGRGILSPRESSNLYGWRSSVERRPNG